MLGHLGFWEILLILVVIAFLFGGKKLPELGRGLGEGIRNFKKSLSREKDSEKKKEVKTDSADEKDN
jgi:sec-independent protein translocase protein TatA